MAITCTGTAKIKHAITGTIYNIDADELNWEVVSSTERDMGPETIYEASVDHPDLGLLRWTLTEYPVGAENHQSTETGDHTVINDLAFGLSHQEPDEP